MGIVQRAADSGVKVMVGVIIGIVALGTVYDGQQPSSATPPASAMPTEEPATADVLPVKEPEPKPASASKGQIAQAENTVKAIINLNGYLCADILDVRPAGGTLFAVRCVEYRSGAGRADYLVDGEDNSARPL